MPEPTQVVIGEALDIATVRTLARHPTRCTLAPAARAGLAETRTELESALAAGETIYGVNTGFGALSETQVESHQLSRLQQNLLRSHAMGVGRPLDADVSRVLVILRAHTLALGASGVSPALVDFLLEIANAGIVPEVPSQGSVGASGDLAPLAHLALVLLGEGYAYLGGERLSGAAALARVGLEPFALGPKEGLSLINGTQVTTAIGALAIADYAELLAAADILGALSLDAHLGTVSITDPRIHAGKPHPGQARTAQNVAALVEGSKLNRSHQNCGRVQDAYSMRCMPQVHGAARQAFRYVAQALTIELNSFTDNPLVLPRPGGGFDVVSGGNFHAGTVALPIDHASAALTTLATISERRLDRFLNPDSSRGLPAFLSDDPGLQSGFMMAQVTASALASECKGLSWPSCVDTIPTSAGKEDHVSMGPIAARKLAQVVENLARVLAIEAAVSARALDLREHGTSPRLQRVYDAIRRHIPPFEDDVSLGEAFESMAGGILAGELREAAGLDSELAAID